MKLLRGFWGTLEVRNPLKHAMNTDLNEFLDHVDQWKLKLHKKLKRMTPLQRKGFWQGIHEEARAMGLNVAELEKKPKRVTKPARRTG